MNNIPEDRSSYWSYFMTFFINAKENKGYDPVDTTNLHSQEDLAIADRMNKLSAKIKHLEEEIEVNDTANEIIGDELLTSDELFSSQEYSLSKSIELGNVNDRVANLMEKLKKCKKKYEDLRAIHDEWRFIDEDPPTKEHEGALPEGVNSTEPGAPLENPLSPENLSGEKDL